MPRLLSGSTLRSGGSGQFISLAGAQPQLPPTATTETGFTLVTDSLLRTEYRSSLGFIEFNSATLWAKLPEGAIRILATGTAATAFLNTSTQTGKSLVVEGAVGIGRNLVVEEDIVVNRLTIGRGYEGQNNIVIKGDAEEPLDNFLNGQESVIIGYDALIGLDSSNKAIAIGRYALSTGTKLASSIAIGDSSLKRIGSVDSSLLGTITNVSFITSSSISNVTNTNPIVVTADNHSLSTGSQIYIVEVDGLTTTTTATGLISLVNEQILFADVLTTNSIALYYNKDLTIPVDGTSATTYISSGSILTPIQITVDIVQNITTGSYIYIDFVTGMTELNQNYYYTKQITTNTFDLYVNAGLEIPEDASNFNTFTGGGDVLRILQRYGNIGIGTEAAVNLIDGRENLFIGHQAARSLTTGSYNIFIGQNKTPYLFTGSGIISIGGDQIVDGLDDQVSIGSVFYYDGNGYAAINAETTIGLGSESTGTSSGALVVLGGAGIAGKVFVGGTTTILSTESSTSTTTGALQVVGGVGIQGDVHSNTGVPDENYLLYTPRVILTTGTVPENPRLGDVWLDTTVPAYLQYIKDGTSTYWIQVGTI